VRIRATRRSSGPLPIMRFAYAFLAFAYLITG
jgi:hypothetical protein